MKQSLQSFYAGHRRWVLGVAVLILLNVLLRIGVGALDASVAEMELKYDAAHRKYIEVHQGWDRAVRRRKHLQLASDRTKDFHASTLGTRQSRLPAVDRALKQLASEFGLKQTSIARSTEPQIKEGVERFTNAFPLKGGYPALRKFISKVEGSDQFFIIERVTLADPTDKGSELNLQISVTTYFALPEESRFSEREER